MIPVSILGVGLCPADLTERHLEVVRQADVLVGGRRLLAFFKDHPGEKKEIRRNLEEVSAYIKDRMTSRRVAVLASGDPLFYGIGSFLSRKLGAENIIVYPNISSVAGAFSRLGESWHDAVVISLHGGRNLEQQLLEAIQNALKIAVLTDPEKNPGWLAGFLRRKNISQIQMGVFEKLGSDEEKFGWYDPAEAEDLHFAEPNVVVLKRMESLSSQAGKAVVLGAPDEWYEHQQGMITKAEVRAVTLSRLRLETGSVLWDLGAGSGSVAIEASLWITSGRICAVEKNPERVGQIHRNCEAFGVSGVEVYQAMLPEGLEALPTPDRVFIGGGGRDLGKIIDASLARLQPGGILVVNTVLIGNVGAAIDAMTLGGLETDIVQIQVSRGHVMPFDRMLKAQNPVWIISGQNRRIQ